jgi:hypothetical protein
LSWVHGYLEKRVSFPVFLIWRFKNMRPWSWQGPSLSASHHEGTCHIQKDQQHRVDLLYSGLLLKEQTGSCLWGQCPWPNSYLLKVPPPLNTTPQRINFQYMNLWRTHATILFFGTT